MIDFEDKKKNQTKSHLSLKKEVIRDDEWETKNLQNSKNTSKYNSPDYKSMTPVIYPNNRIESPQNQNIQVFNFKDQIILNNDLNSIVQ